MLGGLVSWVTIGLLGSVGALAPRGTVHQERSTTRLWRPDGSMGTSIVNRCTGAVWGVWGRGYLVACGGAAAMPRWGTRGRGTRAGAPRARSPWSLRGRDHKKTIRR